MSSATGRKAIAIGAVGDQVRRNLLRLRTGRGLTVNQLASLCEKLGRKIPQSGLTRIELGERRVDVDDLLVLARALNVSYTQLIEPPSPCASCHGTPPVGFSCLACGATAEGGTDA